MKNIEQEVENLRVETNKKIKNYNIFILKVLLAYLTTVILLGILINPIFFVLLFFAFVLLMVLLIIRSSKIREPLQEFNKIYKRKLVSSVFKKVFENVVYIPEKGLDEKVLEDTGMIYTGDRYFSDDYVMGKYKNINLELSDVRIQEKHKDQDGDTYYTTIFSGQWMIFDFNKSFKSKVSIASKYFGAIQNTRNIELEDIEFNKKFYVWSEKEEEAFYIITPNMMERIKKLQNDTKDEFALCFYNNKLYIGLSNYKNLFEPNIRKKINIKQEEEKILDEIKIITKFINDLELDNDLFKD